MIRQGTDWEDPPSLPRDVVDIAIAIDQPSPGTTVRGHSDGVTVTVCGRASVRVGGGSIDAVEVRFGDGDWQPANADAPGFAQWSLAEVRTTAGSLAVVARARHSSGLVQQAEVDVTIVITQDPPTANTVPPTVAFTSPLASVPLIADTSGNAAVTVTGTASDAGGMGIARLEVLVDGVPGAVTNTAGDWSQWRADVTLSGLGAHVVIARAVDGAGLAMEASLPLSILDAPPRPPVMERLLLVEKCRLSSHLGAYGVGRTIKTLSLLPGEKTRVAVKTYKRTEQTATEASSLLDSYTTESQQDFESTLTSEQSSRQTSDESFEWNASGSASATWGWGNASITGGASGGTNAAREELAKNISNAVQKHAAKASAKRDIEIKSSREDKTETGEEFSEETEISNINVSRTLNFVFCQMNQEFITLLTLNNVRVAYVRIDEVDGALYTLNVAGHDDATFVLTAAGQSVTLPVDATASEMQGALAALSAPALGEVAVTCPSPGTYSIAFARDDVALSISAPIRAQVIEPASRAIVDLRRETTRASYQEVTLSQLDALLRRVLVHDAIPKIREGILGILSNVFDHEDEPHTMVEERVLSGPDGTPMPNGRYLRVPKGKTSTYVDPATGTTIRVPGVILDVMRNVMRTDGVYCDALLGQGRALDGYSQGLQDEAVKAKALENDRQQAAIERERVALDLIQAGNAAGAAVYHTIYPPEELDRVALATLPVSGDANGHAG